MAWNPLRVPGASQRLHQHLRAGLAAELSDALALLPVLPGSPAALHDLALVLRPPAVPVRRARKGPLRLVLSDLAAAHPDTRALLVLVLGEEDPLLLGAHLLRDRALPLLAHGPPAHDLHAHQLAHPGGHARPGVALGARAQHALRVRVPVDRDRKSVV